MGALHSAREGADALIYDLMEGFRAALPEAILATMIARNQIRPDMFVIRAERDEKGQINPGCRMEITARRALIQGYESWLSRPVKSRRCGQRLLWRALMEEEARAIADYLLGEAEQFIPYEIDY
jgi:CRISPR-associated protein Cas1